MKNIKFENERENSIKEHEIAEGKFLKYYALILIDLLKIKNIDSVQEARIPSILKIMIKIAYNAHIQIKRKYAKGKLPLITPN